MLVAALDTSGRGAAFCVKDGDSVVLEAHFDAVGRMSANLTQSILQALSDKNLEIADIRSWHIGMGPGSFSGIRSGAALVAGICRGTGAGFGGVPTSYAMACVVKGTVVEVLHDGRRGEVIRSVYRRAEAGAKPELAEPPAAVAICDLGEASADASLVMLVDDPALEQVQERRGAVQTLAHVPVAHLLSGSAGPLEPVYVRPAVFVTPKKIRAS